MLSKTELNTRGCFDYPTINMFSELFSLQALEVARERRPDLGGKTRAGKERDAAKAREEAAVREVILVVLNLLVLGVFGTFGI